MEGCGSDADYDVCKHPFRIRSRLRRSGLQRSRLRSSRLRLYQHWLSENLATWHRLSRCFLFRLIETLPRSLPNKGEKKKHKILRLHSIPDPSPPPFGTNRQGVRAFKIRIFSLGNEQLYIWCSVIIQP